MHVLPPLLAPPLLTELPLVIKRRKRPGTQASLLCNISGALIHWYTPPQTQHIIEIRLPIHSSTLHSSTLYTAELLTVAKFTNDACAAGGVKPTDPLQFICKIFGTVLLLVRLPTGDQEVISVGDTVADVALPTGFTAVFLDITEIDESRRNFNLTLSIANASLLDGGEIICDDTTSRKAAMARCPIIGKLCDIFTTELTCGYLWL